MTCDHIEQSDVVERYLDGTLPEAEKEEFEEHYFSCTRCFQRLETLQTLPHAFAQPISHARRHWAPWALAACLVVAAGAGVLWRIQVQPAEPAPQIAVSKPGPDVFAELAKFDLPRYEPTAFRGSQTPAMQAFQSGMRHYLQGAFVEAAKDLTLATQKDPTHVGALFFLGVCRLLAGDTRSGIESLRRVDAMGLTPYQEEARYYLAKGLLRSGDAEAAGSVLASIVEANGDLASESKVLLDRLKAVSSER
jgi:hypothetical protein